MPTKLLIKRLFDLMLILITAVVIAPLMALIALSVWIFIGKPLIFKQLRPGYHGVPFFIYKFRTMTNASAPNGILLPDAERLTRFGRFLRSTSLDELPEIYNVLKGEMSLVGPRPLLMEYIPLYSPEQAQRHNMLPGITGWAQINGRNAIEWQQRLALDTWYINNWSFGLDIKILFLTLWKVLKREGITQSGHATTEKFKGNQ